MMYNLDISQNTVDAIIRDLLVQDYNDLGEQITTMSERAPSTLADYEAEDLANWQRVRAALVVLIKWYLPYDDYKHVLDADHLAQ